MDTRDGTYFSRFAHKLSELLSQRAGLDNTGKPTPDAPQPDTPGHERFRPAEKDRFLAQVPPTHLPLTVYTLSHRTEPRSSVSISTYSYCPGGGGTQRVKDPRSTDYYSYIQVTLVYLQKNKLMLYKVSLYRYTLGSRDEAPLEVTRRR